jgi:hypothetical protein
VFGEDELAVADDVELPRDPRCDRGGESVLLQLGRETRGPLVVPASNGAIEDFDAHGESVADVLDVGQVSWVGESGKTGLYSRGVGYRS